MFTSEEKKMFARIKDIEQVTRAEIVSLEMELTKYKEKVENHFLQAEMARLEMELTKYKEKVDSDMLMILLYHGGSLLGPHMAYIGGKVHNMGDVDPDHLTLIDIVSALTKLGCKDTSNLYCKLDEEDICGLSKDADIKKMLGKITKEPKKVLHVYADHGVDEQYKLTKEYVEAILKWNPGSSAFLKKEGSFFQRMYVCLDACKKGLLAGCRPIISVGACFLKGEFGGHLLAAIGRDGNDDMFPIAYAVCESECRDTWTWFLSILLEDIRSDNVRGWTFMSNRQKGLAETFDSLMPGVEHRFCVRYLHANFKGQGYKSKAFKDALWAAAQATDSLQFQHHMGVIKSMNSKAFDYLDKIDPRMWSRHAFSTNSKSNMLLNNLPMPFNAWVKEAREKPILTMMETIRRRLMTRFQAKRDGARMANFVICPKIVKKLERSKADARNHIAPCRNELEFEIDHSHDRIILFNFGTCYCGRWHPRRIVNLSTRTCSCGSWQLNGIPCAHACCAIYANKELPEDYVHEWYQMETYIKAYSPEIHAMPGPQECPILRNNIILPPLLTNQHDRPRKLRRRAPEENEPNPNKDSVDRKATMLDDAHSQKIQIRSGQSQSDVS